MAWMNQERKKVIAAKLKDVIPLDWKYSLSVRNHSTLVLTIRSAPVDLIGLMDAKDDSIKKDQYVSLNVYYLENVYKGEFLNLFTRIKATMMDGNHDNSDIMTDYFDVGWYIDINIGEWGKPFICTEEKVAA